jgi:uncharacterized protein YdaU (DUF1376 family)
VKSDKIPAMLWYPSDWLASNARVRMSHLERDVYLTLLFRSWAETPRATLPNDDERLARLAEIPLAEWNEIKHVILDQFEDDGEGRIYNERLYHEATLARHRRKAGAKGGRNSPMKFKKVEHITEHLAERKTKQHAERVAKREAERNAEQTTEQ